MSESKQKKKRHAAVLADCPMCIYCGGITKATTVDHMPPKGMFDGKWRPKELECSSCKPCNEGRRKADLVISLLSRFYPDAETEIQKADLQRLLRGAKKYVPGLIEEIDISDVGQARHRERTGIDHDGGFCDLGGPLVSKHLQAFGVMLGFALHYHATKQIIPFGGGVVARCFSNVDVLMGRLPAMLVQLLPQTKTLKQGGKSVEDQFRYSSRCIEDQSMSAHLASFRQSFAVAAFAAKQQSRFSDVAKEKGFRIYGPGEVLA